MGMERDGVRVGRSTSLATSPATSPATSLGRRIWRSLPWVTVAFLIVTAAELFYEAATYRYVDVSWAGKLCDYAAAGTVLGGAVIIGALTLFLRSGRSRDRRRWG